MTCREIEEKLHDYLENELAADERGAVEDHLSACPRCRRALADKKKAKELLRELDDVEPPPFFEQRIMARVRAEAKPSGFLRKLFFPLRVKLPIQVLSTIAVAFIAYHIYQQSAPATKSLPPLPEQATQQVHRLPEAETETNRTTAPAAGLAKVKPSLEPERKERPQYAPPPAAVIAKKENTAEIPERGEETVPPPPSRSTDDGVKKKAGPRGGRGALKAAQDTANGQDSGLTQSTAQLSEQRRKKSNLAATAERERPLTFAPSPRTETVKAERQAAITMTVKVGDPAVSVGQVKMYLGQINARLIRQEHRDRVEILQADIFTRDAAVLADRLRTMGRLSWNPTALNLNDEISSVTIEIIGNP
jgi:hypothetical protein